MITQQKKQILQQKNNNINMNLNNLNSSTIIPLNQNYINPLGQVWDSTSKIEFIYS